MQKWQWLSLDGFIGPLTFIVVSIVPLARCERVSSGSVVSGNCMESWPRPQ